MTNPSDKSVNIRYLTGSDVWRYMQAKEINANCLRCGQRTWELHDTSSMRGTGALLVDTEGNVSDGRSEPGFIPQVAMTCRHCGSMWTISRGYINEWLDANPLKTDGGIENSDEGSSG